MKIVTYNNEQFKAEKIIKTDTDILGQDSNGNELFAFKGISSFAGFTIANEDGTSVDYDTLQPSVTDLQIQIFNLTSLLLDGGVL